MQTEGALADVRVLVTRPVHQAESLSSMIEAERGEAVRVPTVEILDPDDMQALQSVINRLDKFNIAIFVSANAATKGIGALKKNRSQWPENLTVACVGAASARELQRLGLEPSIVPDQNFSSEGLLACPELTEVAGKEIVIFRGVGGRELLGETLATRGARIEYAECYRRAIPRIDITPLLRTGEIDIVTATSVEALRNLLALTVDSGRAILHRLPLVVISQRVAHAARSMGFAHIRVAEQASDGAIVKAIKAWRTSQNPL
ncbi:MAG: uroporphyrinogen-III synthase [Acidiferrobacterales bacterium]